MEMRDSAIGYITYFKDIENLGKIKELAQEEGLRQEIHIPPALAGEVPDCLFCCRVVVDYLREGQRDREGVVVARVQVVAADEAAAHVGRRPDPLLEILDG